METPIEDMCEGGEGLGPEGEVHLDMKKKTANTVTQCPRKNAFGFPV